MPGLVIHKQVREIGSRVDLARPQILGIPSSAKHSHASFDSPWSAPAHGPVSPQPAAPIAASRSHPRGGLANLEWVVQATQLRWFVSGEAPCFSPRRTRLTVRGAVHCGAGVPAPAFATGLCPGACCLCVDSKELCPRHPIRTSDACLSTHLAPAHRSPRECQPPRMDCSVAAKRIPLGPWREQLGSFSGPVAPATPKIKVSNRSDCDVTKSNCATPDRPGILGNLYRAQPTFFNKS